jgi:apolipoprotein N-acyltransferase
MLLAVASGVLFAYSLPPNNFALLGWLGIAPLLVAVSHPRLAPVRPLYRFGVGMLTGIAAGAVQVGWDANTHGLHYAYLPYIWIALVFGAVAALAGGARKRFPGGGIQWALMTAACGVAVEWATTFSPLPVSIALSQHRAVVALQVASLAGIWGVSFLLWLMNAAVADFALRRRAALPTLAVACGAALLSLTYGMATLHFAPRRGTSLPVAAIQDFSGADTPGVDVPDPTTPLPEREDLIREAAQQHGARLIVGSEEAWGTAFLPGQTDDPTAELAREVGAVLVVGFEERHDPKPFNSAALVGPDGRTLGIHHKLRPFLGERQSIQAGERASAWDTPVGRIGLLICFDNCYTGPTRQAVAAGARIIAQPNYDPPTPRAVLHDLHGALTPFRAVENRVAFVRADPNGRSQIVDPYGRIVAQSPMYRAVALSASVSVGDGRGTPFTRWGDLLAHICLVGLAAGSIRCMRR